MRRFVALVLSVFVVTPVVGFGQTASIGYNFETANSTESGFIPPDTNGAVGPNHVIIHTNGRTKMFSKAGTLAAGTSQTQDNFWSSRAGITGTIDTFDPRVVYDRNSGRWFATANDGIDTANSNTLIAVSPGNDPTAASWFGVKVDMDASADPRWADYNQLSVGPTWVAVTNNMFDVSTVGTNLTTTISLITIPKANLLAGNATGLSYKPNVSPNDHGFTPHTVTDHFAESAATHYTVSAFDTGLLDLSRISGTTNNPTWPVGNLLAVNNYTFPPDAGQQGSGSLVATGDTRMSAQPVLVNGRIWAAHAINVGGLSGIRWYRINPATNGVEAQGNLTVPTGLHIYYPSIAVNQQGDIVIGYSGSASTGTVSFPSTYYTVGNFNGTTTTFGSPVQTFAGTGAITDGRFGDYSATNIDPADPGVFWTFQEFGSADTVWRTRATEVIPTRSDEKRFSNLAGGSLATAANYFAGVAPVATDHLIVSRWQTANSTITAAAATTLARLSVRQTGTGTTTFSLGSNTLTLSTTSTTAPSLSVAEFQGTANVAFINATVSSQTTIVGGEAGGVGSLSFSTAATWTNAGNVFLGGTATAAGGTGTLTVTNGATATVSGVVKQWNTASALTVSAGGSLTVTGGLTNPAATTPTVTVTGANSLLRLNATASPAYTGTITVGIDGGKLDGSGGVAGPVNLVAGGTLQGGTGGATTATNTLTLSGGLTLDGANTFRTVFTDTNPGNGIVESTASLISLGSGVLARNTGGAGSDLTTIVLEASPTALEPGMTYILTIASFGGGSSNLALGNFTVDMNPIGFSYIGTPTLALNLNNLQITFVPTPEPGSLLAVAGFGLVAGWTARRRLRRASNG